MVKRVTVLTCKTGRVIPGVSNPFIARLFRTLFRNAPPVKRQVFA